MDDFIRKEMKIVERIQRERIGMLRATVLCSMATGIQAACIP